MPNNSQKFTEKELEALAREMGKPVSEGFVKDVLGSIREPQKERKQELEDLVKEQDTDNPELET